MTVSFTMTFPLFTPLVECSTLVGELEGAQLFNLCYHFGMIVLIEEYAYTESDCNGKN
jgi:hypothetical protein